MFSYGLSLIIPSLIMDICPSVSLIYHAWMYAVVFLNLSWMYALFLHLSGMYFIMFLLSMMDFAFMFPPSMMVVYRSVSMIYHGCMLSYFPHLLIHASVSECHGCIQWCFFDLRSIYNKLFPWSIMGVYHRTVFLYHYTRCVPQFFPLLSWIYASIKVSVV